MRLGARLSPGTASYLDSRGLVYLRLARYDDAITDYDEALKKTKFAYALYGRGVAKLRKGDKANGNADIVAANALARTVGENFAKWGLTAGLALPAAPPDPPPTAESRPQQRP